MYIDVSLHKLAEVSGDCPIKDFLLTIHSKDPAYATSQQNFQALSTRTMHQIIENYWQYLRLHSVAKKGREHSAFSITKSNSFNSTYQGNQLPVPVCICGNTYWFSDCYYLNSTKKPSGWSENSETQQKVDETLKNPAIKEKVKSSLVKRVLVEQKQAEQQKPETSTPTSSTISTASGKVFSTSLKGQNSVSLKKVLILDCDADAHICNSSMQNYYVKQSNAHLDD